VTSHRDCTSIACDDTFGPTIFPRTCMARMGVVVVSYNARDDLLACICSIFDAAGEPPPTILVDNGSVDGGPDAVRERFPAVDVVLARDNRGYGAAANLGVRRSATPYVLLLNSDTQIAPGALDRLSDYLDAHPRAAIVGPRLRGPTGVLEPSCHPPLGTLRSVLEKGRAGRALARLPGVGSRWALFNWTHDRPRPVPWVTGAALAFRRAAFDALGGFDEEYFMYAEEADLCWRAYQAGWEVHFAPVTDVMHRGGASTAPLRGRMALQKVRSALRFYRRHYAGPRAAMLVLGIRAAMLLRWGRDAVRLRLTRDPAARSRLADDVGVWHRAFRRPDADPLQPGRLT
jgi:N-acetylglucosaminyl-diphospho-decaprenol L-rhamnosyltransferase